MHHPTSGFKKPVFLKKPNPAGFFWVLMGFIELRVEPSRDILDRMHLTLLTALLVVSFVV